ncbi:uncharacterized protein LOC132262287 isoform X2 [Phlebotomus argentipes]|uniref:uncharacterized protein LOC132255706 isoform X2 n=1 Tax=Phlebotomus argentipes TaxID=94469 RepID=UPI002892BFD1|nr:uncharacterized protein LOC132255706 isoform X2 [Phlebotomus argentipes]XP_059609943.1 uncharacterized protein LOC132257172 isoform X2 [Phlebotomus argentipes]XP_059613993.1 uncharacterized protein LOC132260086 isoform X2 [Phlebotomus argentipes]XP_059617488.1 uncharacterized protein LOC132262287 isoform X2 [Phlebotomus argentipes]
MNCSAIGCENIQGCNPHVSFHQLPHHESEKVVRKWRKILKKSSGIEKKIIRVCSDHFLPDDFHPTSRALQGEWKCRRRLKKGVFPTKVGTSPELSRAHPEASLDLIQSLNPEIAILWIIPTQRSCPAVMEMSLRRELQS